MSVTSILESLQEAFRQNGILSKWKESLAGHTSFHIGGEATLCAFPTGRAQLIAVLDLWRTMGEKCPICVLGNGSNVLVSDEGYHGLVVITTRARRVVFEEDDAPDRDAFRAEHVFCQVHAECGVSLTGLTVLSTAETRGLSGLEFANGIPGTVGGAVVMNAGAYGGSMDQVLSSAEYYDLASGEIIRLSDDEMELDYRHSVFLDHPDWIVLTAVLKLSYGNAEDIRARAQKNIDARQEKQPLNYPSAGSVFKRPQDNYAGYLIEKSGFKEVFEGAAQVSEKHAGFIVHRKDVGVATAEDVIRLVARVRRAVRNRYRYQLECEIRYISTENAYREGKGRYLFPEIDEDLLPPDDFPFADPTDVVHHRGEPTEPSVSATPSDDASTQAAPRGDGAVDSEMKE